MNKDFLTKEKKELSSIGEISRPLATKFVDTEVKGQESFIEPVEPKYEEKLLIAKFGKQYEDYMKRVSRWIPRF